VADEVDHPFYEVVWSVARMNAAGGTCYQKFTCDGCGNRLTMDVPNKMYTEGACDNCDTITNIEKKGCNFLLIMGMVPRDE
jgi:hypothetical protein